MCDGIQDCSDGSDEFNCDATVVKQKIEEELCNDNKTKIRKTYWNDFIQDCPGINPIDEEGTTRLTDIYLANTQRYCKFVKSPCTSNDELPCVAGYSRCFPLAKLCVYDLDEEGNLLYCRNGAHLNKCARFTCLGMFKCPGGYFTYIFYTYQTYLAFYMYFKLNTTYR